MNSTIHPAFSFYAVHPAYAGQMDQLVKNPQEESREFEVYSKKYKETAFASSLMAYESGDVYQINEREYYSYADGLRYYLADGNKRIAMVHLEGLLYDYKYKYIAELIDRAMGDAYYGLLIIADTPGGNTRGMESLREVIQSYEKPIGVWVSGMLASAGAYVTAPTDVILANPKDKNTLGSIGIFSLQQNLSKHQAQEGIETRIFRNEGADLKFKPNAYEPWDEEDLAGFQENVNQMGEQFHQVMQDGRVFTTEQWAEIKRGQGYETDEAIRLNLIDGMATREEAFERVASINHQLFI